MKNIIPYSSLTDAMQSLDNGGRFYNFLTKAKDGLIESAELGKVGGGFSSKQQMILFFEMSISDLNDENKKDIIGRLDSTLQSLFEKHKSKHLTSSITNEATVKTSNAIVKGVPKLIDSSSNFKGFIMVPGMSGNVTTFMLMPMMDEYELYKIVDEYSSQEIIVAQSKDQQRLPVKTIIIGGVLKEMMESENSKADKKIYLEGLYYINA